MWHLDEETLNLPDVSLGQPPVVVAQIGQIADAKADDTPREVDEGLGVTVNQFSKGVKKGFLPCKPGSRERATVPHLPSFR